MKTQMKITLPESLKHGLWQGAGIAIGLFATSVFTVAVTGTVTWSGGQTLTAADLNATVNGLVTAVTNIPDWAKSGANAVYTAGNVGIGTNSPSDKLSLVGGQFNFQGSVPAVMGLGNNGVLNYNSNSGMLDLGATAGAATNIAFSTSNGASAVERMRIDSQGKVGIGTTTMNSRLSILAPTSGLQVGATDFTPQTNTMFSVNSEDNTISSFIAQFGSLNAGIRMSIRSDGSVFIPGSLSKGSGTFDIPHPDPSMPKDARLRHSFVESPTAGDNIYRWKVKVESENGKSYIKLPKYWKHLNTNPMVWVSSANEPSLAYGYVDTNEDMVIVQANKVGTYNVLLLGTRKDEVATNNWKILGLEYISKGVGEAEKILSFQDKPETGVYSKNSEIKVINETSLSLKINKLEEENAKLNAQIIKSISDRELEKQRISNLESTLGKLLLASKNQTTANSEKR